MIRHLLLFRAKLQRFLEQKKRSPLGFWNMESLRQRLSLVSNPDGETAERICMGVKHLILTERINQLLSAPTLAAFEEKVIAHLPKEQEQKVVEENHEKHHSGFLKTTDCSRSK